jgi:GT2 family glycosyltransferase
LGLDSELGYRLGRSGLKLYYESRALGYHYHPTSIKSIKSKMLANGRHLKLLAQKLPWEFLPPLAKYPNQARWLKRLFFPRPVFWALERLAFWLEDRAKLGLVFDLVLLNYRIEGLS